MHSIFPRGIEFAVQYSAPGAYILQVASFDDPAVAHRVLVLQFAINDVAEDFRIPVRMLAKSPARLNYVVVDDPERSEAHVVGVEVVAKREAMPAMQPAEF